MITGGLAEEVDEKILNSAFIPFGEIIDIQIPLDYESEKHRGFAFIEFETAEDAASAIDNMVNFDYKINLVTIPESYQRQICKYHDLLYLFDSYRMMLNYLDAQSE